MDEWITRLCDALDVPIADVDVNAVLDLARDAAHNVDRPAAPITTYIVGYAAHCWELFAIRSWLVAFLTFAAGGAGLSAPTIAALINLLGPPASISGNEIASGRRVRVVRVTMAVGAALACLTGLVARQEHQHLVERWIS